MIKKDKIMELEHLVRKSPGQTCYEFSGGKMFATLEGDTSCLTGETQKTGDYVIDGKTYAIFVGGSIKKNQ